jgi:filamentous hemagglutinin
LIASIFNGPGEKLNLVPMNGNFNKGAFRDMERMLADAVTSGKKVEVKIEVIYDAGNRPTKFAVEHVIDGIPKQEYFRNAPGG